MILFKNCVFKVRKNDTDFRSLFRRTAQSIEDFLSLFYQNGLILKIFRRCKVHAILVRYCIIQLTDKKITEL